MAGPLVTVNAVRDLTLPWLSSKEGGKEGGKEEGKEEKGYLIDPVERLPHKWLALEGGREGGRAGGRQGPTGAPWSYGESFELFLGSSSSSSSSSSGGGRGRNVVGNVSTTSAFLPPSVSPSIPPTRLRKQPRAKAQLKTQGAREGGREGGGGSYPLTEDEAKQVDFYVGRDGKGQHDKQVLVPRGENEEGEGGREGGRAEGRAATSYLFCPQAYGVMAPEVSDGYWAGVEQLGVLREGGREGGKEGGRTTAFMATTVLSRNATLAAEAGEEEEHQQEQQEQEQEEQQQQQQGVPIISARPCPQAAGGGGKGGGDKGDGGGEIDLLPHMLFLLPAHSLDWGSQAAAQGQQPVEGWLEVGCRLTSMRVVKDVRFAGTASP